MPYTCTCVHSLKFNMLVCLVFPLNGNGVILSQHPCSETLFDSDVHVNTCIHIHMNVHVHVHVHVQGKDIHPAVSDFQ